MSARGSGGSIAVATRNSNGRSRTPWPASSRERLQRVEAVGVGRRLVGAPAQDPREAHGDAGLVPAGAVDALEAELEDVLGLHGAHRPEPLERVRADPAVEPQDLGVVEARV